jgi:hypothetical protein
MVSEVVVVGIWMVVLWFGLWIPVLVAIAADLAVPRWVPWILSPFGPVAALVLGAMVVVNRQRRLE